ncbi:UDP-glucuronosyltransferase 1-2-like [Branchiostoma floridae x Branchiostoma belcheri]
MTMALTFRDVTFVFFLFLFSDLQVQCSGGKTAADKGSNVLIINQLPHSTWLTLRLLGRTLAARGHNVTMLMPDDVFKHLITTPVQDKVNYEGVPCDPGTLAAGRAFEGHYWEGEYTNLLATVENYLAEGSKSCEALLLHLKRQTAKGLKYNVVLSTAPDFPCGPVLARYLGIPSAIVYVPSSTMLFGSGNPFPLAYWPVMPSGFTTEMTFKEKIQNVLYYAGARYYLGVECSAFDFIVHRYISNDTTTEELLYDTDLWLSVADFTVEFARPTMPNVVNIAGYNSVEPKPLSKDLEAFMESSGDAGVILFSLGSTTAGMPERIEQVLLTAFAQVPQKVIWKLAPDIDPNSVEFPPNVKPMSWVPQDDLLAHNKTRLFVTHGGTNGVYESVHHRVPMVSLPLAADHHDNVARVVGRGFGVKLDIFTMTTEELLQAINHVLSTKSYQENVDRAARILADQPTPPMDRAMWWIEHLIRHGGLPHLRTRAHTIPFHQYFLLDVIAFFVAVLAVVLGGLACVCRLACRQIVRGKQQQRKEKKHN